MSKFTKLYCSIFSLLLVASSFVQIPAAYACSPTEPDPWFVTSADISAADLNPATQLNNESNYDLIIFDDNNRHTFTFDEETPIHLLYTDQLEILSNEGNFQNGVELADEVLSSAFLVENKFHRIRVSDSYKPTEENLELLSFPAFVDPFKNDDGGIVDPVPDPQTVTMGLAVDGQLQLIPLTITFDKNPTYNPNSFSDGVAACSDIYDSYYSSGPLWAQWWFVWGACIGSSACLAALGVFIFRRFKK